LARVAGYTLANGVENLVLFGTVASGTGNTLDNFLIGNAANNSLNGGVGSDTLSAAGSNRGLGQRDTLTGGAGNDVFILADENGSFYDDGTSSSTGVADFAYITDFNASQDSLVLSSSAEEYSLVSGIPAGVTGITGTGHYGLFRKQGSTDELVAVIKSANTTILSSANTIDLAQFVSPIG
jgi:Ca2+-binding RTX toxin-like protein